MKYEKRALIEFIESVIKVRNKLNGMKIQNLKNRQKCNSIIINLQNQIDAYKSGWDIKGIQKFLQRNYQDIVFLIPENKSGKTRIETLNKMIAS